MKIKGLSDAVAFFFLLGLSVFSVFYSIYITNESMGEMYKVDEGEHFAPYQDIISSSTNQSITLSFTYCTTNPYDCNNTFFHQFYDTGLDDAGVCRAFRVPYSRQFTTGRSIAFYGNTTGDGGWHFVFKNNGTWYINSPSLSYNESIRAMDEIYYTRD